MAKRIIEGSDRAYTINVYAQHAMDGATRPYAVTLSTGSKVAVDKKFSDPAKALAFYERAVAEGHVNDGGTGTPEAIERIKIEIARAPLVMGMRVRLEGRGTGRISHMYMTTRHELTVRMDDGRTLDTTVFDVAAL